MALSQSMGIAVPKMSLLVNRTTGPINGMFNGQPLVIPAGYRVAKVPVTRTVKGKDGAPDTTEPVVKDGVFQFTEAIVGAGVDGAPLAVALPDYAAEMVKRQNVIMGSEDPENFRDVLYLIGCEAWGDDISHVEQSKEIERFDRSLMGDDARTVSVRGDAGNRRQRRSKFTDARTYNPMGIKGDVG